MTLAICISSAAASRNNSERSNTVALESEESQLKTRARATDTHMLSVPLGGWWRLALIAAVALSLTIGLTYLMVRIFIPLSLLLFAIVVAEALTPIISSLQRWMPRGVAIVVVYVVLLVITALAAWLVFPPVVSQITQGVTQLPTEFRNTENYITAHTGISNQAITNAVSTIASRGASRYGSLPIRVVSGLFDVVLVYFLSIYWLFVTPPLKRFILSLFPKPRQDQVAGVLREMGHDMGGYLRGSVISGFITGGLAYAGLLLVGVDFALALGVLTFFGELIPVIGVIVVGAIVVIVALFQGFTHALFALGVYTVILFLESHLIAPNIMRSQTTVSQVTVLFALVAGYEVGGILGALVAIPLSAGVRILVIRVFAPGIRSWTGADPHPEIEENERERDSHRRIGIDNAFKSQNMAAFIARATSSLPDGDEQPRPEESG